MLKLSQILPIAQSIGFDGVGASPAGPIGSTAELKLRNWLSGGMHGGMGYMERNLDKRLDPTVLVPGAKAVISALVSYSSKAHNVSIHPPKLSRYAIIPDYHRVVKGMLYQLLESLRDSYGSIRGRAFVDSAPVLDRAWAQRAGLGWLGKNSMLISPKLGSYIFIGELIIDVDVEASTTESPNQCGACTRCMDACPTGAIVSPGVVDARRCISYLTIEELQAPTPDQKRALNGWGFGCDVCQEVCPWNAQAPQTQRAELLPLEGIVSLSPGRITSLTREEFDKIFGDTPVARAGFDGFMGRL